MLAAALICLLACTPTNAVPPAPPSELQPPMPVTVTANPTQTPWKPVGPWSVEITVQNYGTTALSVPAPLPSGFSLAQVSGTYNHGARFEATDSIVLAPGEAHRETWDLKPEVAARPPPSGAHTLTVHVLVDGAAAPPTHLTVTVP